MRFRRVHDRLDAALEAESAASAWSAPAIEGLEGLFRPYLRPGEAIPDLAFLQELVGRVLADHRTRLRDNGMRQEADERNLAILRVRRDEAAEELREALRSARFYFDGLRGRGYGKRLGLGHGLSRLPPKFLAHLGLETANFLELEPPAAKSKQGGLQDPHQLATFVRDRAQRLADLLANLPKEKVGRNHSMGDKRRSLQETEDLIRRCTAFLAGLYLLGDRPDLAKRVRPVLRRPKKRRKAAPAQPVPAEIGPPPPPESVLADLDLSAITNADPREPPEASAASGNPRRRVLVRRRP